MTRKMELQTDKTSCDDSKDIDLSYHQKNKWQPELFNRQTTEEKSLPEETKVAEVSQWKLSSANGQRDNLRK